MAGGRVALYLRLSREDAEKGAESQSIANQRAFLTAYARDNGFEVAEIFADDGISGTTFDRPAFRRMLAAIESGRVDTVITKDLSRLGRDYIQTGHFLERYFPERGVRYIAVNDHIDTADSGGGDITPFLSVVNDLYARDISKKVRAALDTKKRLGKFIGSTPPYGYRKDPADRNRLLPDPETAPVVREIFRIYLARASVLGTAKLLTKMGIATPGGKRDWSDAMVRRILTNPTYAGDLTQNRARKVNYKVHKVTALPRAAWIVVPHTHEALVPRETFACAQRLLAARGYAGGERKKPRLLSGLVFCADCGAAMTFQRQGERRYLVCGTSRRPGKGCTSHCIRESTVLEALRDALRDMAAACPDTEESIRRAAEPGGQAEARRRIESEIEADKTALAALYRDKANGTVAPAEYAELRASILKDRSRLEALLRALGERERSAGSEAAQTFLRFDQLERPALLALVDRVVVHSDKSIDIAFRFCRPAGYS